MSVLYQYYILSSVTSYNQLKEDGIINLIGILQLLDLLFRNRLP